VKGAGGWSGEASWGSEEEKAKENEMIQEGSEFLVFYSEFCEFVIVIFRIKYTEPASIPSTASSLHMKYS
jgi:hypothetical protein